MKDISAAKITQAVQELCIEANLSLSGDMKEALLISQKQESSPLGRSILDKLARNLEIAETEQIPICQDTGMAVVFLKIGQEVHITDGDINEAVHEGVRRGYREGYLRKSVVADPLIRENTGDNTPAVIHTRIVPGDRISITVAPKGFGSENMSRIFMLKPADGEQGVEDAIVRAVQEAGPNACPPMVVGVGVGGTFEKCAQLAKEALLLPVTAKSEKEHIRRIEENALRRIRGLGIGPAGLGGSTTAFAVHILTYATHIAGLPVAVNICCHVNRHASREISE